MIEQVAWNKSSLLWKNILQNAQTFYNYLQWILKQKAFAKVIENAKRRSLDRETWGSIRRGGGAQALKVRFAELLD